MLPTHGYDVAKQLRRVGLGEIKGGTLYPVLGRLEDRGHLRSHWISGTGGPGRKLVEITPEGVEHSTMPPARGRPGPAR